MCGNFLVFLAILFVVVGNFVIFGGNFVVLDGNFVVFGGTFVVLGGHFVVLVATLFFFAAILLKLTSSGAGLPDHWLYRRRPPHLCRHRGSTHALDSVQPDCLSQLSPYISRYQYTSVNNGAICEGWKTLF